MSTVTSAGDAVIPRKRARPPALTGTIEAPGDKSISHRALVLASLAGGRSRLRGLNVGSDVLATAAACRALGAECIWDADNAQADVQGCGWTGAVEPEDVIDAGNSGTTLRILLGVCAGLPHLCVLTGDASLRRRPMLRVVVPLRQMGAVIDGRRHGDRPPLAVRGGNLRGIDIDIPVASAQVKSALLLAGLNASGETSVTEPSPSRDHTERMLGAMGVPVTRTGTTVTVRGGSSLRPLDRSIPGDPSSASFLIAAALVSEGSELVVRGVGTNPTRTGVLDVLADMGARIEIRPRGEEAGEPVGDIVVTSSELRGVEIGPDVMPRLIDEIPILAVLATQARGRTTIRGASELRVKESDRISALVDGLSSLGADIEGLPDGLVINGPTALYGGTVDPQGDHRMALSFAIAGLVASERVRVQNWSCVATSFPDFLERLGRAQGNGS